MSGCWDTLLPRRAHRSMYRTLQSAVLAGLLIGAATSDAQSPVKQVLMLQSLDRGNLTLDHFTSIFRVGLDQRAGKAVNVVQVVVGQMGFIAAPQQDIVDYIRAMYSNRAPPDLIMTVGGPAAIFARKYRQQLFPQEPLVFAALDQRYLRAPLSETETALPVINDLGLLVDDILRVLPDTRQIFMVTGSGAVGRFMRPEHEAEFARFRDRVSFIWSDQLTLPEIMQRVANLPAHSAIIYQTFGSDAQGGAYPSEQVIDGLHARANAPMFSAQSPHFGLGVVGGSTLNIDDLARRTADVASRILNGEPPAGLRMPPQVRGAPIYDWRELRRWGIPESRVPPGSIVQFRPPGFWSEYKGTALTAAGALILQSLLIALLLYERRGRQRAEIESKRHLSLAADSNRRQMISALTTSIAHELTQPLSAIVHNAEALQRMVVASQAPPETTGEILTDIKEEAVLARQIIERHRMMLRSHEINKKPIDLNTVIENSVTLLAYDMRQNKVEARLELSSTPCVVQGDPVLLQQVVVNLVRNAVDALGEMPVGRRGITIRSEVGSNDVEMSICDTGPGFPSEMSGALFTPFVTTKSEGLGIGLTIAQGIVKAHGGTIAGSKNDEGGATFTITLPRTAAIVTEN